MAVWTEVGGEWKVVMCLSEEKGKHCPGSLGKLQNDNLR